MPLATSVRALHALARRGLVEAVGLCNVTVGQIEEARRITDIASVQVELSLWNDDSVLGGVVQYCITHGIPLLAYRPLGGPDHRRRIETDPVLAAAGRGPWRDAGRDRAGGAGRSVAADLANSRPHPRRDSALGRACRPPVLH